MLLFPQSLLEPLSSVSALLHSPVLVLFRSRVYSIPLEKPKLSRTFHGILETFEQIPPYLAADFRMGNTYSYVKTNRSHGTSATFHGKFRDIPFRERSLLKLLPQRGIQSAVMPLSIFFCLVRTSLALLAVSVIKKSLFFRVAHPKGTIVPFSSCSPPFPPSLSLSLWSLTVSPFLEEPK